MSFLNSLKNAFLNLIGNVIPILKPVAIATAKEIEQIAVASVMSEADKVISGKEKFNSAVSNVLNTVSAQGKSIVVSAAQTAVQSAYDRYLANK